MDRKQYVKEVMKLKEPIIYDNYDDIVRLLKKKKKHNIEDYIEDKYKTVIECWKNAHYILLVISKITDTNRIYALEFLGDKKLRLIRYVTFKYGINPININYDIKDENVDEAIEQFYKEKEEFNSTAQVSIIDLR